MPTPRIDLKTRQLLDLERSDRETNLWMDLLAVLPSGLITCVNPGICSLKPVPTIKRETGKNQGTWKMHTFPYSQLKVMQKYWLYGEPRERLQTGSQLTRLPLVLPCLDYRSVLLWEEAIGVATSERQQPRWGRTSLPYWKTGREPNLPWECLSLISLNLTGRQNAPTAELMGETVEFPLCVTSAKWTGYFASLQHGSFLWKTRDSKNLKSVVSLPV